MSRPRFTEHRLRRGAFSEAVRQERNYQREQWGDQHDDNHNGRDWVWLLTGRLGDVADAVHGSHGYPAWEDDDPELALEPIRASLVKLAAVCLAATDSIDRAIGKQEGTSTP